MSDAPKFTSIAVYGPAFQSVGRYPLVFRSKRAHAELGVAEAKADGDEDVVAEVVALREGEGDGDGEEDCAAAARSKSDTKMATARYRTYM